MSDGGQRYWVELVGNVIVARVRGTPNIELIRACHERVIDLANSTGCRRVMYDALEMERPPVDTVLKQQQLTPDLHRLSARIALVVPNASIAYLGRLAFGDGDHRVFYNDIAGAFEWLTR